MADIVDQISSIRTFNTAKKYAEELLFPKMDLYQKFLRQSDFGHEEMDYASQMSSEIRDIGRVNGLKGMTDTVYSLLISISSTVRLKNHREETECLENCLQKLKKIKSLFYNSRDSFYEKVYVNFKVIEKLDIDFFEKIRKTVNNIYINTEILMTKNKLLFSDSQDEFLSDKEVLDKIKQEYIEN